MIVSMMGDFFPCFPASFHAQHRHYLMNQQLFNIYFSPHYPVWFYALSTMLPKCCWELFTI